MNKEYGHVFTDLILKEINNILMVNLPETSLVSRLNGDDFAILLLPNSSDFDIRTILKILMLKLNDNCILKKDNKEISIMLDAYASYCLASHADYNLDELLHKTQLDINRII